MHVPISMRGGHVSRSIHGCAGRRLKQSCKDMEQQNDDRLNDLAGKLASIRQVTNDIYTHASDHSLLDSASETFSSMLGSLRSSSVRLTRAARAGHPVMRTVGIALGIIILFYILFSMFR